MDFEFSKNAIVQKDKSKKYKVKITVIK